MGRANTEEERQEERYEREGEEEGEGAIVVAHHVVSTQP